MSDSASIQAFFRKILHPVWGRLYLLAKLPAAYWAGVRVREADPDRCVVTVPYKWLSQNPFRSIYFACLSMAAEMSTGVLAMGHLFRKQPPVSMLVVKMESAFLRKATERISFSCTDGALFREAIAETLSTGEARTVRARSVGVNAKGEAVAEFYITWSFKARSQAAG